MNKMEEIRYTVDVIMKYIVLLAFTFYLYHFIEYFVTTGKEINMPDWIIMLFTTVFLYFFRRSPKKGGDNETINKKSTE